MLASTCGDGIGGRSFSSNSLRGEVVVGRFALCPSSGGKPARLLRAEETGSMRRVQCGREKWRPPLGEVSVRSGTGTGRVCPVGDGAGLIFAMEPEVSTRRTCGEGGCLFPKPSILTMSVTFDGPRSLLNALSRTSSTLRTGSVGPKTLHYVVRGKC